MKPKQKRLLAVLMPTVLLFFLAVGVLVFGIDRVEDLEYPRPYETYVTYYAEKYGIDPLLLYALIRTESGFDPQATSSVDARGLTQITEVTFDWIKGNIAPTEELTFADLYDPETSIRFGCYFISYCLLRYDNDVSTAAAAYHSGWGTVDKLLEDTQYSADGKKLDAFPYEQMNLYVKKINAAYSRYRELYG